MHTTIARPRLTLTKLSPSQIIAAKDWIIEAFEDAEYDVVDAMKPDRVVRFIHKHYSNGIDAFVSEFTDEDCAIYGPTFDRDDIQEAHYVLEVDYNENGQLRERASNRRRKESTYTQLVRMGFRRYNHAETFNELSENGKLIYRALERRYNLTVLEPAII
ncbi:hypothetical protein EON80_17525 [bacterium]|nr:MAG: hypothetical protein EON80_17525 [bacterium]